MRAASCPSLLALRRARARWRLAFCVLALLAIVALMFGAPMARAAEGAAAPAAAASGANTATDTAANTATDTAADTERLKVADPYLELHTGPGRGYPVFFVVARGQSVVIELRHTDWYKVRTQDGKVGWVNRHQLETTLTAAGGRKTFRDLVLDDYLKRRFEFGAAWGRFQSDPMLKLWLNWKMSEPLSLELTVGQVQGRFSGSDFWHLDLQAEPWADQRLSPFLSVGFGQFKNIPNSSLVDAATTDAKLAHAGIGVRWYFSERFVMRADYSLYTAFVADDRNAEYKAATIGLSFFF